MRRGGALRLATAGGLPPAGHRDSRAVALFFDAGGPRWPREAAEPSRRPPSREAVFWSWGAVVVLVAALVLPFSVAALSDLIRYLSR